MIEWLLVILFLIYCILLCFIGFSRSEIHQYTTLYYELIIQSKSSSEGNENNDSSKPTICGGIADDILPTTIKYKKWKWLVVG